MTPKCPNCKSDIDKPNRLCPTCLDRERARHKHRATSSKGRAIFSDY